jgi:hypothetical protein
MLWGGLEGVGTLLRLRRAGGCVKNKKRKIVLFFPILSFLYNVASQNSESRTLAGVPHQLVSAEIIPI